MSAMQNVAAMTCGGTGAGTGRRRRRRGAPSTFRRIRRASNAASRWLVRPSDGPVARVAFRGGVDAPMISDVLFEAIQKIEDYEHSIPSAYGDADVKAKIVAAKAALRTLQHELDAPPTRGDRRDEPVIARWSLGEDLMSVAKLMQEMKGDEALAWRFCISLLSEDGRHDDSDHGEDVVVIYRRKGSVAELARQMNDWRRGHMDLVAEQRELREPRAFADCPE